MENDDVCIDFGPLPHFQIEQEKGERESETEEREKERKFPTRVDEHDHQTPKILYEISIRHLYYLHCTHAYYLLLIT